MKISGKKHPGEISRTRDGQLRSSSTRVKPAFRSSTWLDAKPGLNPAHEDWSCTSLVWMLENSSSTFQTHRKVLLSTLLTRPSNSTCKSYTLSKRPRLIKAITKRPAQSANTLRVVNGTSTFPSKNLFLYFFFAPLRKSDCRNSNQGAKQLLGAGAAVQSPHYSPACVIYVTSLNRGSVCLQRPDC